MPQLARADLESLLRTRRLDRTLTTALPPIDPQDEYAIGPSGVTALDATLGGGFPRGQLSELVGPRSSGRTSLLLRLIAAATARGECVALVDALDMLDVESAAAAGVDLERLLWVRGHLVSNPSLSARDESLAAFDGRCILAGGVASSSNSPAILGRRALPSRRLARLVLRQAQNALSSSKGGATPDFHHGLICRDRNQRALAQAIRAFTLVLQAGRFGLVILDLAEAPPDAVRRLPFTTWLRLQRLLEGCQTMGVLVGNEPMARSSAGLTIKTINVGSRDHAQGTGSRFSGRLFEGLNVGASVIRARARGCENARLTLSTEANAYV